MRFITGNRRKGGSINMTPLIDLMFLLVIFILIAARFEPEAGLAVDLPSGESREAPPEAAPTMRLVLTHDGLLMLDRVPVTLNKLAEALQAARENNPDAVLIIEGDQDAPYGLVAQALDQARLAGQIKINLKLNVPPATH